MKRLCQIAALLAFFLQTGCEKDENIDMILRLYGDAYEDIGYSIAMSDQDIIIGGLRTVITRRDGNYIESSDRNMGIFKTGPTGLQKWEATPGSPGDDEASKVIVLPGGEIIAAGMTVTGTGLAANSDIYLVKLGSDGQILWQSTIGGSGNEYATDIVVKPDGGFMLAGVTDAYRAESGGFTENIAGKKDFLLVDISSAGDSISSYAFGYGGDDICARLKSDRLNGYILFVTTDNSSEPGLEKNNLLLIRLNEDASNRGASIIGDTDDEYAADIEVLADGYLLTATVGKEDENTLIEIIGLTTNIQDDPRFTRKFSISGMPSAVNTIAARDGIYYIGGRVGTSSSSDNLFQQIDEYGESVGEPIISGGTGSQEVFDLLLSEDGFIYAAGTTVYENNTMMCMLKFKYRN